MGPMGPMGGPLSQYPACARSCARVLVCTDEKMCCVCASVRVFYLLICLRKTPSCETIIFLVPLSNNTSPCLYFIQHDAFVEAMQEPFCCCCCCCCETANAITAASAAAVASASASAITAASAAAAVAAVLINSEKDIGVGRSHTLS